MSLLKDIKIVINAEDKTSKAFKDAQKNVKSFGDDVSKVSKQLGIGMLAAGTAAVAFLYSAAKGAAEAEASMARVDSVLKTMGTSALKNRDALLAQAGAAVKLGFDDEAAAESLAKFYQRTNDLTEATKLNNLAMDLARAKNIDLAAAGNLVGQVLSGNGRVLKQYGIELDETRTPLQALGDLQVMVAGQATAFSNTFQGRMMVLSESFSNLKDTIGAAVIEAVQPFINSLVTWAQDPSTIEMIKNIAAAIGQFASVAIPLAIESVITLYSWFKTLTDGLTFYITEVMRAYDQLKRFYDLVVNAPRNVGNKVGSFLTGLIPGRATGGPVSAGSPYIVGENGPELFVPSRSGGIIPNGGGMGSITINITGNTLLDRGAGERIAEQIMQTLRTNLRI